MSVRFSRLFTGVKNITRPKVSEGQSRFFRTSESLLSPKLPLILERYIGKNEAAKQHYFTHLTYFEEAKNKFKQEDYSSAKKYIQHARYELAETTDLRNLTMSLFRQIDDFEKQIQANENQTFSPK